MQRQLRRECRPRHVHGAEHQPSGPVHDRAAIRCSSIRHCRRRMCCALRDKDAAVVAPAFSIQDKVEILREDLTHLFDEKGVDKNLYNNPVDFRDPITKYSSIQGYLFNLQFLKLVFNPKFEAHDIKVLGPQEIISRWTMTMDFVLTRGTFLQKWWKPVLIFTGTSVYGFNKDGRIDKHIDTWDSISKQEFFSLEAFFDFGKQLLAFYQTPNVEGPTYTVLKRTCSYEIRRYKPFTVAEVRLTEDGAKGAHGTGTRSSATAAFQSLANYIFGGNEKQVKMAMTSPVITTAQNTMQFVMPSAKKDAHLLPEPLDPSVKIEAVAGGVYAVKLFTGIATPTRVKDQTADLKMHLKRDGLKWLDGSYLARYNDPSVRPPFRRNEVWLEIENFQLW